VATAVGRKLPIDGAAPTVVPDSERRSRMLLAGLDQRTQAIVQVAVGDRCEVEQAGEGDLLETIRDRRPDLLVLDWNAPALASRDVLEELRADPVTRESKVLLVVRDKQARTREVARADADETLATPFSPLQLQVKLRKLLGADAVAI
jgi:serine/threonine-protein kinase